MATNKHKLLAEVDATHKEMVAVVDPKFLIRSASPRFGFWFSDYADLETARAAIVARFPEATCTVEGDGQTPIVEPEPEPVDVDEPTE